MSICYVDSPVGRLALEADHDAVTSLRWAGDSEHAHDPSSSPVLEEAMRQLDRYFNGKLARFDLPLAGAAEVQPAGTPPYQPSPVTVLLLTSAKFPLVKLKGGISLGTEETDTLSTHTEAPPPNST